MTGIHWGCFRLALSLETNSQISPTRESSTNSLCGGLKKKKKRKRGGKKTYLRLITFFFFLYYHVVIFLFLNVKVLMTFWRTRTHFHIAMCVLAQITLVLISSYSTRNFM